jgi:PAT family beta-lactamase induction signal transducer AmpG
MVAAGAGALVLADRISWKLVYLAMAGVMALCAGITLWAEEPHVAAPPPRTFYEAVALPFFEFFGRAGSVETLAFMTLYRVDYNLTTAMTTPFMMGLGFSKTDIGLVTKGLGLAALIAGSLIGGALILRLRLRRALFIFGATQAASGAAYMLLAHVGRVYSVMAAAIVVENICGGMSDAALTAFMMSLCNKRFTATQMALLTSFEGLSRYVASAPSGYLAQALDWPGYFMLCCVVGVPALLMLAFRFGEWRLPEDVQASA